MNSIGIYLHIPFCDGKCPYCDFYSVCATDSFMEQYTNTLCSQLEEWSGKLSYQADTLYIGGGTPSLLGGERLSRLIRKVREHFLLENAEITVEVNPCSKGIEDTVYALAEAGANRLSIGMQTIHDNELQALGRKHRNEQVIDVLRTARLAGIQNVSLDVMLGIPHQTEHSLKQTIKFCADMDVSHVSAYLLKFEPGTPFYENRDRLSMPEERERELYFCACESLEYNGFEQYEISNFCKPGMRSAHNMRYWRDEPYLGLGPSAHSFINGRRFYYLRSISDFMTDPKIVDDGEGGGIEEYSMLRMRLTDGLDERDFYTRFGKPIPYMYRSRLDKPELNSLCQVDNRGIRLTREGFLVSNLLIGRMLGY